MEYLAFGCRSLLFVVFTFSALGKVSGAGSFAAFRRATAQLVPPARGFASWLAAAVIVAEFTIATLLTITAKAGLAAAFGLLAAFTAAIAAAIGRGSSTPCRCFGRSDSPLGARHLARNAVLLIAAGTGLAIDHAGAAQPLGLVVAGLTGLVLGVLVQFFDDLADLFLERTPT